ncbi:hypothetical protein AN401_17155 [Zobellella denitrificans]|uniref:Uncharacterized protein n=1 Tax=Zobellella denitrificans TaxID=347534 RepID=A0A291HT09_9GAMM|nr:hypothetical protein AN401_17155 [Zobellella denitrificans]
MASLVDGLNNLSQGIFRKLAKLMLQPGVSNFVLYLSKPFIIGVLPVRMNDFIAQNATFSK